jgi:Rhs element Vgr protein
MAAPPARISAIEFTILVDGTDVSDTVQVITIVVEKQINSIPTATLTMTDGDAAIEDFPLSTSGKFAPGKEIEIKAGSEGVQSSIFKGIIVGQSLRNSGVGGTNIIVDCKDKAVKATINRKYAIFEKKKDSDAMTTLAGNYSLTTSITATTIEHPLLVQYNVTDWDFIVSRAEVNGHIVIVDAGKITTEAPNEKASAILTLTFGTDVVDFDLEIDSSRQLASVTASAWDQATHAMVDSNSSEPSTLATHDPTAKTLAAVVTSEPFLLKTSGLETAAELKSWADGLLLKSRLSRVVGTVKCFNTATILPGKTVELAGFGSVFNGNAYVSGVKQEISSGIWMTEVTLGTAESWFAVEKDITAYPASGQIAAARGLNIGVVTKIDSDPGSELRIQIKDALVDSATPFWARMGVMYASKACGNYFMPEIDDEVIYGYLNEDPRFPVVLGSMYSSKNPGPYTPESTNKTKAIVTKSLLKITFDDTDKILTLLTPAGNTMILDDKVGSVTVKDKNSNSIVMDSSGVVIKSAKDLTLDATGNVTIKSSTGKIASTASAGDVTASGLNVTLTAQIAAKLAGSATAEISASGQTTVKGAIVMIN